MTRKNKRLFRGLPENIQALVDKLAKAGGTWYLGTGRCQRCGHTRWNVSGYDGPEMLPCPRCAERDIKSIIKFTYSKV